jgi:uncharacterized protein (AIM24 family)
MRLAPGQTLRVDSGCLVALTPSVTYEIKYAGKIKTSIFGGEGLFYASLTGPGQIWLQSLPVRRLGSELLKSAVVGQNRGITGKLYLLLIIIGVIVSIFYDTK